VVSIHEFMQIRDLRKTLYVKQVTSNRQGPGTRKYCTENMYSKQNTDLLAIANGKYRAAIDSVYIQCTRRSKIDRRRMDRYTRV